VRIYIYIYIYINKKKIYTTKDIRKQSNGRTAKAVREHRDSRSFMHIGSHWDFRTLLKNTVIKQIYVLIITYYLVTVQ
jgi:hypothetical protein